MVVEVAGRSIAVFNVGGQFYALDNICMHRGGPLGEGFVDQNNLTVQCPWHGSQFDVKTGRVVAGPAEKKIDTYEHETRAGEVYVTPPADKKRKKKDEKKAA